jgi:N-acetylglucosamine kinase-like BadF-type ATPase
VGLDEAVSHIDQAINEACTIGGITRRSIVGGCVALAGVKHPIHHDTMKEALDQALGIKNLQLVSDAEAALSGALDGQPGVVVIAGTGSIAVGIDSAGRVERSGGWGPAFSDEGSGFDIARRLLHAVVASFDGRQPNTILTERVCRQLGISTAEDLPGVIYSSDSPQADISSLATLAVEAAGEGDAVARDILSDAGRDLGALVVSVLRKLGVQTEPLSVAYVGSVFQAGEYVLESFREVVLAVAPNVRIGPALFSPAVGAVKLLHARV